MSYDNARASIGDHTVGYRVEGSGEPALILLHGFRGHSGAWRKNIPFFAQKRMVVAPSMPVLENPPSVLAEIHAEILARLVEVLGVSRLALVGNSLGGLTAMIYAGRTPHLVCGVVLEDSAGYSSEALEKYSKTGIPTLIVWGERDTILPLEKAQLFSSRIPGSELVVFREAGHTPHWDVPEEFNHTVERFLEGRGCAATGRA